MGIVKFFDTTLRDGEQTPGVNLSAREKLEIARQLARLKVDVIEAGFPITSVGDFEAVKAIAEKVEGPVIAALARANKADIDRAWEAVKYSKRPRIHTFIATSPIHMQCKLKKSPEEVLKTAREAVAYAKSLCDDVEFSAEDATRSDPDFLCTVFGAAVEAGATVINIPDTVGYTTPEEFRRLLRYVKEHTPGICSVELSVHCHNDLGLAVANSLAAIEEGVTQIECTVNGIGERAGNTSLEEVAMALYVRRDQYAKTFQLDTTQIYKSSKLVSALTGISVQPNKAVVGMNAFAHQSGIHQDGVLKERTTYEIMNPQVVGVPSNRLVLGKVSGRHAFREKLREMGYEPSEAEVEKLFREFKLLCDRKKEVHDEDLQALLENELRSVPEEIKLEYFHVTSGNNTVPTATIRISQAGRYLQEAASGDGPIDALFNAIDRATGFNCHLIEYSLKAVTSGKDALGEVSLKLQFQDRSYTGRGISTDVIEASVRAYMNALNRLLMDTPGLVIGSEAV
ncbi:MAG TPA: 2-isopropylmalate synthase [Firmicutes bacterium]|nr:2-isopropylmalate synthase [Bacillota bacterium]